MAAIKVRKKTEIWQAIQYLGPTDHSVEFLLFMDGVQDCLVTYTLAGLYKLQLRTDDGTVGKASVNDWILKDSSNNFKIVKENKLAIDWIVVP